MAEYIEREKAIAYVEEQYRLFKGEEREQSIVEGCVEALKFTPVADVVPVVRCKDCKHGDFYCNSILCGNAHAPWYNDEFDALMELDDYCSYGERDDKNEQKQPRN